MENQTLDLIAKLLANENINVVRAAVSTASFNIVNRTLTLPMWKEMTPTIDQMLVAHEVAHALYTTTDYITALETTLRFKNAMSYLNILEDVRVEKLIKRRYPGIRKVFNVGYKELNDMDFFDIRGHDLKSIHLMDRINLYFKVGYGVVDFSPEEKQFVDRAAALETIDQAVELARDINDFLQHQRDHHDNSKDLVDDDYDQDQDQGQDQDQPGEQSDDVVDQSPADDDLEQDQDQDQPGKQSGDTVDQSHGDNSCDQDNAPTTNTAFDNRVSELADTSTTYKYWTLAKCQFDPVVPFMTVNKTVNNRYSTGIDRSSEQKIRSFKLDTQNNVSYMVKEFEMRKAATTFKRSKTSKTGSLDARKLWAYKLNDDLFKCVTTTKQGKNHGMVFLLDWSASMKRVINDTIDQLINLVMFCQRVGIAYQVFAFTNGFITKSYKDFHSRESNYVANKNTIDVSRTRFALLELFSSKMSAVDFNTSVNNLKSSRTLQVFPLGGTPLNEALIYMYDYIEVFQKTNNVEKVSFITLTDGLGESLPASFEQRVLDPNARHYVKVRHFVKDQFTKKNIEITSESATQTNVLISMIKNRYNCTVLGFYIAGVSRSSLADTVYAHYGYNNVRDSVVDVIVDRIKSDFQTKGYGSLNNTGRDQLFIVPTSGTKVQYGQLEIDNTASSKSIASKFTRFMSAKKTSRILLNEFIGHIV
jgi:hypothetical protein